MNLLEGLGSSESEDVTLLVDNVSAINLANNPIAHGRSKHIDMRFSYLSDLVSEGLLGSCNRLTSVVNQLPLKLF